MIKIIKKIIKVFSRRKHTDFTGSKELNGNIYIDYENSSNKEKTLDELYPNMTDNEVWNSITEKDEDNWTIEEEDFNLKMIFYNEHKLGRSKAINELVNCNYKFAVNGNPFKELINFTLIYFENNYNKNPTHVEKIIKNSFPNMHLFILQQISLNKYVITNKNYFDEQKAYDEFLIFLQNLFCSKFPDKIIRDEQIIKNFKILHNDLIKFIENENFK